MKFIRKAFHRWLYRQPLQKWMPQYAYVEQVTIFDLHSYLRVAPEAVGPIVVVGACYGHEVGAFRRSYANATFTLIEGSPKYAGPLVEKFKGDAGVTVHPCLASDADGEVDFHEGNLGGTGSMLPASDLGGAVWGLKNTTHHRVPAKKLDTLLPGGSADLLWMDVQGAEMKVLAGAADLLARTKAVFCEVSLVENIYEGAPALAEIEAHLKAAGFTLVFLGLDPASGTGNSLFVRTEIARRVRPDV